MHSRRNFLGNVATGLAAAAQPSGRVLGANDKIRVGIIIQQDIGTAGTAICIYDDVRISEVAITDTAGNVLAIGKTDRHIVKKKNDFVVFDVQIII